MGIEAIATGHPDYCEGGDQDGLFGSARGLATHFLDKAKSGTLEALIAAHGADADGFGFETVMRLLEETLRLAGIDTQFDYVRPMRYHEEEHEHGYATLGERHKGKFLISGDVGGADLTTLGEQFREGIIIDHHPVKGEPGKGFRQLNPIDHGYGGNTLSGAGAGYLFFDAVREQLEQDGAFRTKEAQKEVERLGRTALVAALAGSNADRIDEQGVTRLLYEQAKEWKLLRETGIGAYGYTTKQIHKVLAESSIPANLQYPVLRRQQFLHGLAGSLGKESFTSDEVSVANRLYKEHRTLFMQQYRSVDGGLRVDESAIEVNLLNAQALKQEEIDEVNKALRSLGARTDVLVREEVIDWLGVLEVVSVDPSAGIRPSEFRSFTDDVYETEERCKTANRTITQQLRSLEKEAQGLEKLLKTPNLAEALLGEKRLCDLTPDELGLLKRWWRENIESYADPFKREGMIADLDRPNYLTEGKGLTPLLAGRTLAELGNVMTAISKTGLRDHFIDALILPGERGEDAERKVHDAHKLYRTIIYEGLRAAEHRLLEKGSFAKEIADRVYLLDFSFLEETINDVAERHYERGSLLTKEEIGNLDLKTLVGVFAGILTNTRKMPEHYALVFAYVPDLEQVERGIDGIKLSGRVSERADDIFPGLHLGEDFLVYDGGGHAGAAAVRLTRSQLPGFLKKMSEREAQDEKYKQLGRVKDHLELGPGRRA